MWAGLVSAAALVPGFAAAPLRLGAGDAIVVVAVLVLAAVAYANQAVLADRVVFSAHAALAVVLVVVAGPIAAFVMEAGDEVLAWILGERRRPLARAANIASTGWGVLAAAGVLAALGHPAASPAATPGELGAVAAAGGAFFAVNYAIGAGIVRVLADGHRLVTVLRREFLPALPAQVTIVVFGAISATLTAWIGVVGLLPIVVAIIAPQTALMILKAMARPASELSKDRAATVYAHALADTQGLSRRSRRQIAVLQASGGLDRWGATKRMEAALKAHPLKRGDHPTMLPLLIASTERWDGDGWPGALSGPRIPLEARIARVADRWAQLTCAGGPELSQAEALTRLTQLSETELDPTLVESAREVLATEPRLGSLPSPAPVLHRLPRPRAMPRAQAARLVAAIR